MPTASLSCCSRQTSLQVTCDTLHSLSHTHCLCACACACAVLCLTLHALIMNSTYSRNPTQDIGSPSHSSHLPLPLPVLSAKDFSSRYLPTVPEVHRKEAEELVSALLSPQASSPSALSPSSLLERHRGTACPVRLSDLSFKHLLSFLQVRSLGRPTASHHGTIATPLSLPFPPLPFPPSPPLPPTIAEPAQHCLTITHSESHHH